jgi:hypothetical protein
MSTQDVLNKYREERTKCQVWTRVMGYLRNVDNFNTGKKGEYKERVFFTESKTCPCCCQEQEH